MNLGIVKNDDYDIYQYGFELIISLLTTILVIIFISFLTSTFLKTVLFLLGFFIVRIIGGGYHAKHHYSCFITTISMYIGFLIFLYLTTELSYLKWIISILCILSGLLLLAFSPVEHSDNPMTEYRKKHNRKLSIIFSFVIILGAILPFFLEKIAEQMISCVIGVFFAALTLLAAKIENIIKERRTCDEKAPH